MKAFGGSSFGAQPASTRATAPAHGFGTGVREQIEKIYLSKEHAKYIVPDVPAPMHVTEHALGRQHLSYKRTAPAYAFARADRFAVSSSWSGANIPGPGAYTVGSSIGPQVDATRASRPRYGFGKNSRSIDHRLWVSAEYNATFIGRQSPAADYNIRTALGTQPEARRRSAPSWCARGRADARRARSRAPARVRRAAHAAIAAAAGAAGNSRARSGSGTPT